MTASSSLNGFTLKQIKKGCRDCGRPIPYMKELKRGEVLSHIRRYFTGADVARLVEFITGVGAGAPVAPRVRRAATEADIERFEGLHELRAKALSALEDLDIAVGMAIVGSDEPIGVVLCKWGYRIRDMKETLAGLRGAAGWYKAGPNARSVEWCNPI